MKSKKTKHSQIVIYFTIRNMPKELSYSMNNIHLVALCDSSHLKSEEVTYNNLWQRVVDEISTLEVLGIDLKNGMNLKGIFVIFQWNLSKHRSSKKFHYFIHFRYNCEHYF